MSSPRCGLGNAGFGASVLPLPLEPYGAPGCWLLHDFVVVTFAVVTGLPMTVTGSGASLSIGASSDTGLIGLRPFHQVWGVAPGANGAGALFSNGLLTTMRR